MKAREKDLEKFVGKTISDGGSKSVFKCVGYNLISGLLITEAVEYGWHMLGTSDVVDKECGSYWYLNPLEARIIK